MNCEFWLPIRSMFSMCWSNEKDSDQNFTNQIRRKELY